MSGGLPLIHPSAARRVADISTGSRSCAGKNRSADASASSLSGHFLISRTAGKGRRGALSAAILFSDRRLLLDPVEAFVRWSEGSRRMAEVRPVPEAVFSL